MVNGIIFDIDGTLVDTYPIQNIRDRKNWKECVSRFHECCIYDGIFDLVQYCRSKNLKIGVVTNSVSYYSTSLLKYFSIPYDYLISYHDTVNHKPHSDPVVKCLNSLGLCSSSVVAIGDSSADYLSYSSLKIFSIGAGWNPFLETIESWDVVYTNPRDVIKKL